MLRGAVVTICQPRANRFLLFSPVLSRGRCLYRFSSFRGARLQLLLVLLRWRKSLVRHRFLLRFELFDLWSNLVWHRSFFLQNFLEKIKNPTPRSTNLSFGVAGDRLFRYGTTGLTTPFGKDPPFSAHFHAQPGGYDDDVDGE